METNNILDLIPAKPAPSMAARRLLTVAAFVESHGFTATARDGAVFFRIPFTGPNGEQGSEGQRVETIAEARMALGY